VTVAGGASEEMGRFTGSRKVGVSRMD